MVRQNTISDNCNTLIQHRLKINGGEGKSVSNIAKTFKLINSYNKYIDNACYHTVNYYENINLLMSVNLSKKEIYNYD